MMDDTGLVYLRARYYEPDTGRFIQIDNNYEGESESVVSQNRYVYTLNNPYKYVDRNGNWSLLNTIGNAVSSAVKTVKKIVKKTVKAVKNYIIDPIVNKANKIVSNISSVSNWIGDICDGITNNTTSKNSGGNQNIKPLFKVVNAVAKCPTKEFGETKDDIIHVFEACMDWPKLINETYDLFKRGFKMTGWSDFFSKCAKEGTVKGVKLSANGARAIIKKVTGLATGPRTKIKMIIRKVFLKFLKIDNLGELGKILKWGKVDVISFAIDVILNITVRPFRIAAIFIADLTYKFIRKAGSALIRAVLTPFMGPFAWLLGTIIDIGVDIVDFFIDLKGKLTDFAEWLVTQAITTITSFINEVLG